ncbi:hypothetical protein JXQ70_15625 [bacterium]|nr:hypothetical protein [bacterium]
MFKKICLTVILLFLIGLTLTSASTEPAKVVRIFFQDKEQAYQELRPLHLTIEDARVNWVQALVNQDQLEKIKALGYRLDILYDDVRTRAIQRRKAMGSRWTSYASAVTQMQAIASAHPEICRLHNIGQSTEGRSIYVMEITDNPLLDETNEAEVRLIGNIHGDEYISMELMMLMIQHLTDNYGSDLEITNLVNNREIWIQPSVNPDGHEHGTRENINGVDMNRNHGYMWNYGGSGPFSEIELQRFREYSLMRNFSMSLTFHGVTTYFNYCWNFTGYNAFDKTYLHALGEQYRTWNGYTNTEGYDWYQTNGDTNDWSYGCRGSFDITIETPGYTASDVDEDWDDNRDAMLYIIKQAGYGLSGIVTDQLTGEPLEATVLVHQHPIMVYTDPNAGDYHRPLQAGVYDITVWANGYAAQTINSLTVLSQHTTLQNMQLVPDNNYYAMHVCWNIIADEYEASASTWHGLWPHRALGPPDGVPGSLGRECELVLDMGEDFVIQDGSGDDLIVYEADMGDGDESFELYGSIGGFLGPWVLIGSGIGTTAFDLDDQGLDSVRYLMFVDTTTGDFLIDYAGFDLDAVHTINHDPGCGLIILDHAQYTCDNEPVQITVEDQDLNTTPLLSETVLITIYSDSQPAGESVTLTEVSTDSDTFQGVVLLSEIQSGAGYLQVHKGDTITAEYNDGDCEGVPQTVTDTALANCDDPEIVLDSVIIDDSSGNADGVADPGETIRLLFTLTNTGNETATAITGILVIDSTCAQVTDSNANWPDLAPGQSAQSLPDHFEVMILATAPVGELLTCSIELSAGTYTTQITWNIHIGQKPVLVIDDGSDSADTITDYLIQFGLSVDQQTAAATDPADWSQYEFIVWSCGDNESPVAQSSYRNNLESYVADGGRLWIEGGELGYDALRSPGYASFAANVLHCTNWTADSAGNITVYNTEHPLNTTPSVLPATMSCSYDGYGDEDALVVDQLADRVCAWSTYPATASLIGFDNDSDIFNGGQIVFSPFDMDSLSSETAQKISENIATWLSNHGNSGNVPALDFFALIFLICLMTVCIKLQS